MPAHHKRAYEMMSESYARLYGMHQIGPLSLFSRSYGPWGTPRYGVLRSLRRKFSSGEPDQGPKSTATGGVTSTYIDECCCLASATALQPMKPQGGRATSHTTISGTTRRWQLKMRFIEFRASDRKKAQHTESNSKCSLANVHLD